MAIAMSGQLLLGHPVMVKPSEAEKNLVQSTTAVSGGLLGPYSGGARRLYVGNLPITIKEDQLRQVGHSHVIRLYHADVTQDLAGYICFFYFLRPAIYLIQK